MIRNYTKAELKTDVEWLVGLTGCDDYRSDIKRCLRNAIRTSGGKVV